jgi:hypothetical protein
MSIFFLSLENEEKKLEDIRGIMKIFREQRKEKMK